MRDVKLYNCYSTVDHCIYLESKVKPLLKLELHCKEGLLFNLLKLELHCKVGLLFTLLKLGLHCKVGLLFTLKCQN